MKSATAGLLSLLLAPAAGPAVALSCDHYQASYGYWWLMADDPTFFPVRGHFSELSRVGSTGQETSDEWTGRLEGHRAWKTAFDQPFDAEVRISYGSRIRIASMDAVVPGLDGVTGIVWVKDTDAGYVTLFWACMPIVDARDGSAEIVLDCINGNECQRYD
jgi:hypothetical protein